MRRRLRRREVLAGLVGAPFLGAPAPAGPAPLPGGGLAAAAAAGGRYFGAAARIELIRDDTALRRTLLRDCAWVAPEFHMNWDYVAPAPGRWNFRAADGLVTFASGAGLAVRGHSLIWDQSTPRWAQDALAQDRDWGLVRRHFRTLVGRWGPRTAAWNVVNEPIARDGEGLLPSVFLQAFGPDYIRRALEEAHHLDPQARLAINDYGFDYDNPVEAARRRSFLRLLEQLKATGAPLHEVGVQAHLDLGKGPIRRELIAPFLQSIADLDLRIVISELDVQERDASLPLAERDRRVADEVRRYLDIALDQPAVDGVFTWGLSDAHSWLQPPGSAGDDELNRGLPYDAELRAKPMYRALRDSLARA